MRKVFTIALLCAGLVFAANDKPSDLKQIPSSEFAQLNKTFKTLKKKTDAPQTRAVIDVPSAGIPFNADTDSLYEFTFNNVRFMLATPKDQMTFAPFQKIQVTSSDYGKTLCAYMGTNQLDTTVPGAIQDPRVGINSAGGWFYLTAYPTTDIVIFDRSSSKMDALANKRYEHVVFRFVLNTAGQVAIHRTVTEKYTTDNVTTPKAVPLNQWVYIQGKQKGLEHSVGWKTASDESIATKTFAKPNVELDVSLMKSAFMSEGYAKSKNTEFLTVDLVVPNLPDGVGNYRPEITPYPPNVNVNCTTMEYPADFTILDTVNNPVRVQEFFWQPNMEMFAVMNDYDAVAKDISQVKTTVFQLDENLLLELLKATEGDSEVFRYTPIYDLPLTNVKRKIIKSPNFDVWVNGNRQVVLFDLRQVPPAR